MLRNKTELLELDSLLAALKGWTLWETKVLDALGGAGFYEV